AMPTGSTGSGKTSMLKWIEFNLREHVLYVIKPPEKPEIFTDIIIDLFPLGFFEKIMGKRPNLYNLPAYVNKKLKGNRLVFLLDESHETNKDVLEWLRVITDQIENVSVIMAGLPNLEQNVRDKLETLDQRITTRISLVALDKKDMRDLVKKRIESVGGTDIIPFTEDAIDRIYNKTGGFPREVLKSCDKLVSSIDKDVIDGNDVQELREVHIPNVRVDEPVVTFSPKPPSKEQLNTLPYKQRKIIEVLSKSDWLTPGSIVEQLEFKSYKTDSHAVRSINNILHRLMLDGFVQREARGKAFMYALTPKIKTLMVEN
ncbi:MAG: AAA family ATPase, partial [Candidatus Aenigmarchaeota archaeon]|nr:AAA family ATPase [Candidatus Aenigmarchaeota archaeon]